ncbi:MAG: minor capsid protein, partial [Tissierellia bacterium]|nr:minor capsid protein [Tissierellia bacterium]
MAKKKYSQSTINYFARRKERRLLEELKKGEDLISEMQVYYQDAVSDIGDDIAKLFGKYVDDNNLTIEEANKYLTGNEFKTWRKGMKDYLNEIELLGDTKEAEALLLELNTLAMRSRISRLEGLQYSIKANMAHIGTIEESKIEELLMNVGNNAYYKEMYDLYLSGDKKVLEKMVTGNVRIDSRKVAKIVNMNWSGANYSKNIWDKKYEISRKIEKAVASAIVGGTSPQKLISQITKETDLTLRKNVSTLVRTEISHVVSEMDYNTYSELGLDEYRISGTLDNRTSTICQYQDGKIYKLSEKETGKNYPPFHPNCRSVAVAVTEYDDLNT